MTAQEKIATVAETFENQVAYCRHNDAPITARISEAIINVIDHSTQFGAAVLNWVGDPILDALPLRCTAGFHSLYLAGKEPALAGLYAGEDDAMANAEAPIVAELKKHDAALLSWLDSPPQTNEAGRSSNFVAALHWLATTVHPDFELLEIGSSAGMNLLIDRFAYDLGGVISGPADATVTIKPKWIGTPPPDYSFTINSVKGCDISTINVRDPLAADRLRAYIWPEAKERFARLDAGIKMINERGVDLEQCDAADWIEAQLAKPQTPGTTRVLMHSIVWQYIDSQRQNRILAAMKRAAEHATVAKPLAWIALETNRKTFRHELKVQYWPGCAQAVTLGEAHAHGAWIKWLG